MSGINQFSNQNIKHIDRSQHKEQKCHYELFQVRKCNLKSQSGENRDVVAITVEKNVERLVLKLDVCCLLFVTKAVIQARLMS